MFRLPLLAAVAALALVAADAPRPLPIKVVTHKVKREKLQPQIIERGTFEAANGRDILCELSPGRRGSPVATAIKRLFVQDGDKVKKGQLLVELDSSNLADQLTAERIASARAEADVLRADGNLEICKAQNEADLTTAEEYLKLAEMDLERYQKSEKDRAMQGYKSQLLKAEADAEHWSEELDQAEARLKRKEGTERQVRIARLRLDAARLALTAVREELEAFEKNIAPRMENDLRSKAAEAAQALERTRQRARENEKLARENLTTCKAVEEKQLAVCKAAEEEMKKCKIVAPQDGIIVYYAPEQVRVGRGAQQAVIAEGEPVREGQKLMSIADPSKLQVAINVPETVISQVRSGMAAEVRAEAFPERALRGTAVRIATIPSARDFLSSDEKVFRTVFAIEGDTTGLRPGMTATVTMPVGKPLDSVLTLPARALIGRGGFGKTVSCLVLTADGPEEREVVAGFRNEQIAEIVSGLREGDEVIVNPQLLLNDLRDRVRFTGSGKLPARREQ